MMRNLQRIAALTTVIAAIIIPVSQCYSSIVTKKWHHKRSFQHDPHHHHHLSSSSLSMINKNPDNLFTSMPLPTTSQTPTPPPPTTPTSKPPYKKKKLKTYQRYLEVECWKRSELRSLEPVLQSLASACKQVSRIVQRAQTDDLYGNVGETNIQGEVQQKLDVVCNDMFLRAFCGCSTAIAAVASEEEDFVRNCGDVMGDGTFGEDGEYVAVFDPIDGSKNIDASLPVGTVFGIYKKSAGRERVDEGAFLQMGNNMVVAGYCLYSATTMLVLTLGSGVDGFTLDPDDGVFLHTHPDIRIPSSGPLYSFNEANFHDYSEPVQRFLDALKAGSSSIGHRSSARYIGALVADVHNVLINGGIYGYPGVKNSAPEGKLRLLYESNPMAMIMEQAGGAGSTGTGRILDKKPTEIHQRVPTFLGSIENVYELDQFHRYYGDDDDDDVDVDGQTNSGDEIGEMNSE